MIDGDEGLLAQGAARTAELRSAQGVLTAVRLAAVPFAAVQVLTFYRTYPPLEEALAWAAVGVLLLGAAVVGVAGRRASGRVLARWAVVGLLVDATAALLLVVAHTFDPETAIWALLYLIPVEGAVLFQLRGALWSWGLVAAAYSAREVYGALVHDVPLLVVSITFRMGVGLLMAVVLGVVTRRLVADAARLRTMAADLEQRGADLTEATAALRVARDAQAEFVAVTNHELRTPLTAITGFARTLVHRWTDMDDGSRLLAVRAIEQQSHRLGELVEDVLTVSAVHAGPIALDLRPLLLRDRLEAAVAAADVEGVVVCEPDLEVIADPARLRQVLANLLSNARKYGRPPVEVTARAVGDRVVLTVRDHGPGVPPAFRERMYEEFTQASVGASRTAEGYGLGLAIVRYLVRALGGTVAYDDHPEGGAVFTLDLPAACTTPADR